MRTILHIDMNNFYASVECLYRPEIREFPVAVAGDPLNRHGIILAKNMLAKKLGVKTGEAIWQAKLKAPNLVTVPPDFRKYLKFSRLARQILYDYTDQIEPFGIDENWIDVTGSKLLCGDGSAIANSIRQRSESTKKRIASLYRGNVLCHRVYAFNMRLRNILFVRQLLCVECADFKASARLYQRSA